MSRLDRIRVVVESPYAGDIERNMTYLKRCMLDSVSKNEAPLASHMLYTQFLDDSIVSDRDTGIDCGLAWGKVAEVAIFYTDYGHSSGMQRAMDFYVRNNIPMQERRIGVNA